MADHPKAHRGSTGLSSRLRIISKGLKDTAKAAAARRDAAQENERKKGLKDRKKKQLSPFGALRILVTPGAKK